MSQHAITLISAADLTSSAGRPFVNPIDFASLLCSRLCHDLVNPIGALTNGAELLADEQDAEMRASCVKLLDDSARQTAAVLTYFRLAFGGGGGYGAMIAVQEPQKALTGRFPAPKIAVAFNTAEAELPRQVVKILMNIALIAGESLVRGGQLQIEAGRVAGTWQVALRAEGPRVIVPEDVHGALSGQGGIEPSPRVAPSLVARMMLEELDGQLALSAPGAEAFEAAFSIQAGRLAA